MLVKLLNLAGMITRSNSSLQTLRNPESTIPANCSISNELQQHLDFNLSCDNTKIHFVYKDSDPRNMHPIKALSEDRFLEWQCFQRRKNFECEFVLSLIKLPEKNKWLFGGVYRVLGRSCDKVFEPPFEHESFYRYQMELLPINEEFIGKLVLNYKKSGYGSYLWAKEEILQEISVDQVLRSNYAIR